ncbi:MAG: pyridoxamine 5'-phosphate oxidase [Phycisphaeraceae bacterium]
MSISDLRQSYDDAPAFDVGDLESHPIDQFNKWFKDAQDADIFEPNAMTLATVDPDGRPDARMVLLKDASDRGFTFFTNLDSTKARQIRDNPEATLVFYWDRLYRQVRIRGSVTWVSRGETRAYWETRPIKSQLGAIASDQSRTIKDRQQLEDAFKAALDQHGVDGPIPLPDDWGGYRVIPSTIEFWQGQRSRLHDRLVYVRDAEGWQVKRLAP